ncbi:MAG: hypothetical protein RL211_2174 [Pseudomonadota bacterium]
MLLPVQGGHQLACVQLVVREDGRIEFDTEEIAGPGAQPPASEEQPHGFNVGAAGEQLVQQFLARRAQAIENVAGLFLALMPNPIKAL